MKRFLSILLFALQCLTSPADILTGRVVDADNGEPLVGAQMQIQFQFAEGEAMMIDWTTDTCGVFRITTASMSSINITFSYFGYETLKKRFSVPAGNDLMDVGDLPMKMSEHLLNDVNIEAKAARFTMKGDTVIFNPDAFNLEEGARFSELLKKLPGVRLDNGKLTFNGKEVKLMMNGMSVSDDFLIAQLPAEAVDKVKAYERKSELAELSGMDDGQEQQILDVIIKPGFMDRWYGQTKLSAYASENYRASANLHYLSEKNPLNFYVRASDSGSKTYGVYGESDYDWDNAVPQRQQYGNFSYQRNWEPERVESSYNQDYWSVTASPQHLDTHQNSWQSTETFLSGEPSSMSNSHSYSYEHGLGVPLAFSTNLHFGPRTWLSLDAQATADKIENRIDSEQETYRGVEYTATPQTLVNSSTSNTVSLSENNSFYTYMVLNHVWEQADFSARLSTDYSNSDASSDSHSVYDYRELGTVQTLDQSAKNNSSNLETIFDTKYSVQIVPGKLKAGVAYWLYYSRTTGNSEMFTDGQYDSGNSYERMKSKIFNEPRAEVETDLGKWWMLARLKVANSDETLDYQRGQLDTVMHHNTWYPRPHFQFTWHATKTSELSGYVDWEHETADMLESSAYVDRTNPLYVTMGNPELKGTSTLSTNLSFSTMSTKGQQMLSINLSYRRDYDPVSGVSTYNSQTGGYTRTSINVDDRQNLSFSVNYDRALGEYFRLRYNTGYGYSQNYGVKTRTSIATPIEHFRQMSSSMNDRLNISYDNKGWESSAFAEIQYTGVNYTDPSIEKQKLWHYNTGMNGKYKTEHWTFDLQGRLTGNTGYLSDTMNRNRFALDASVTWKILEHRGQLTLDAKDILNQMDETGFNITPTMRSENRNETFHRYLSLTFTYNFDARAK